VRILQNPTPTAARRVVFMEEVEDKKHVVMLDGGERRYLTEGADWHLYPDINTQGDQVTLVSGPNSEHLAVSVMDLTTGKEHFLTTAEGRNLHPTFSGDGKKIAFSEATGDDSRHIVVMDSPLAHPRFEPPSKPATRVVPGSEGGYFPSLSEDGNRVLYQRTTDGLRQIVSYDFATKTQTVEAEGMAPSLSPDGSAFAFTKKIDGQWNIHVKNFSTGEDRQITHTPHLDFAPSFAPDGSVYFASNRAGTFDIYHLDSESLERGDGVPTVIAQGPETYYAPEASA
jgi:dipeptidyl aminopeptidase/acylaminoacyl peptidase